MKKSKLFLVIFIICIGILLLIISYLERSTEKYAHFTPKYEQLDLSQILTKTTLTDDDYQLLLTQTGLGRYAINQLIQTDSNYINTIKKYQYYFFKPIQYSCKHIAITTKEEHITNSKGKEIVGFPFAPYKNGYVLLTKCSHSLGWRNGHAALVVDATNQLTIEAIKINTDSSLRNIQDWRSFPSFIMLRYKGASDEQLNDIATSAKQNLMNVPYQLTIGLTTKKYFKPNHIEGTNCAHLVWEAFQLKDFDIDSDGGRVVTVKDIAQSDKFEIVQVYGIDPENIWN